MGPHINAGPRHEMYRLPGFVREVIRMRKEGCDIVNSSKSYNLETGDIVKFEDMPVNPFGHNWNTTGSQYYMITSLNRSIGSVSIECREVG